MEGSRAREAKTKKRRKGDKKQQRGWGSQLVGMGRGRSNFDNLFEENILSINGEKEGVTGGREGEH